MTVFMERFELSCDRIKEISGVQEVNDKYKEYFAKTAEFILSLTDIYNKVQEGVFLQKNKTSVEELRKLNKALYADILDKSYESSYGNPEYACEKLGEDFGQILSFIVDKNGQIYVIELKKGLSACCGKAGLRSHAESFRCTIERDSKYFVEEMKCILEQKKELGLIADSIKINDNKPKFVFAYETKDGESIEAFYEKCVEEGVGNFNIYICEDSVLKPYNK